MRGAHDVTLADNVVGQWADLERNLESYSDSQFVSDEYLNELRSDTLWSAMWEGLQRLSRMVLANPED